jgi:hypothetical protein
MQMGMGPPMMGMPGVQPPPPAGMPVYGGYGVPPPPPGFGA